MQYAILDTIKLHPGIDQISLANLVALDRSNTGDVVGRLEDKGLLYRSLGATDRRTKRLNLTEAGLALVDAMNPDVEDAQERILAPLSEAERKTFMVLLDKLVDVNNALSRAPARPKITRKAS